VGLVDSMLRVGSFVDLLCAWPDRAFVMIFFLSLFSSLDLAFCFPLYTFAF